jgi:hypothetical protein
MQPNPPNRKAMIAKPIHEVYAKATIQKRRWKQRWANEIPEQP